LIQGALAAWKSHGGEDSALRIERVPGAYELPLAARAFALSGSVDAVIALGCVIRGDTAHFEFVAGECAHGLQRVMLDTGVPVSFGVLTVENQSQALERASPDSLNKGGEAMTTALVMVDLLRRVK
jgi:6,7-dimethyl-8-ribityllumazine synthase